MIKAVHLFYDFLRVIVALLFLLIGASGLAILSSSNVQALAVQFFLDNSYLVTLFSLSFLIIGLLILGPILMHAHRRYYHLRVGSNPVSIDLNLLHEVVMSYWKELFPHHEIPTSIRLKSHKIHIKADLPSLPEVEQPLVLEKIERDLGRLFSKILGLRETWILSLSFTPPPEEEPHNKA